jgi:hypothetical protein
MMTEQELLASVKETVRATLREERERAAKEAEQQRQSEEEVRAREEQEWLNSLPRSMMPPKLKSDVIQKYGVEVYNSIPWSDAGAQRRDAFGRFAAS